MACFEWADDRVNELHTATTQGCGQEVVAKILNSLVQYTAEHLRMEEQEMAAVHFPHLERHEIGHLKFTESLRDLQQKYDAGSITVASQLSTVLRDWLSLHLRRSDKKLLTFMKKSRKK